MDTKESQLEKRDSKLKTIPDIIDNIIYYINRGRDIYYRIFEYWGSKMNVYGWNGRWKNRRKGTGYAKFRRKN
jgi:hypothetical protein